MAVDALQEEEFTGQINWSRWRQFVRHARPYAKFVWALVAIAVLVGAGEGVFTLITWGLINEVAAHGKKAQMAPYVAAHATLTAGFCACICAFILLAGKISTHVAHDVRKSAFDRLQELSFSFYDHRPVGWLVTRLTTDCDRLSRILAWGLLDLVWGACMILTIPVFMLVLNWQLALLIITVIPPLVWLSLFFQKRILRLSRAIRKTNSKITASFNEGIMGVRTTKTLVREAENLGEFRHLTGNMYASSVRSAVVSSMYFPLVMALGSVGVAMALWAGGLRTMAEPKEIGTLIAFMFFAAQFFMPIHELARIFAEFQGAQAAAERVMGLLATEPEIKDSPEVIEAISRNRQNGTAEGLAADGHRDRIDEVRFEDVCFAYANGRPVLENFSLTARAGETIALVGPTGGGKSTIVSLLCRFYEPTAGRILIDGTDYHRRSLHWLQSNLGIVLQTPHLFSGTVADNIRYGNLAADDEQVAQAARLVSADAFITSMENGYDTEVGEGGGKLSTGQKQLVSFARAVLADPRILVMDEATSSVDTETEQLIQKGLRQVLEGRISFIIAHRLSTIRSADRILVIENGRTIEQGDHHELIRRKGRYYQLYTNQFTREKESEILAAP